MNLFKNIQYLQHGNLKQQKVYNLLNDFKIIELLKIYNPLVVGTVPIAIDLDESDVDIILETIDFDKLEEFLIKKFSHFTNFTIQLKQQGQQKILLSNFVIEGIPFEIYAENQPTHLQNGFLHMIKEFQILNHKGIEFKKEIINLKKQGYKTEPAFAKLLNLQGNPYVELLRYKI